VEEIFVERVFTTRGYERDMNAVDERLTPHVEYSTLLAAYLDLPSETAYSEHLHVTVRRKIQCCLEKDKRSVADFSAYVGQPHVLKDSSRLRRQKCKLEIGFLVARLLAELGNQSAAEALFAMVSQEAKTTSPATPMSAVMGLLADNCRAVVLQNQGNLRSADSLLMKVQSPDPRIVALIHSTRETDELFEFHRHLWHKHLGTLQRRLLTQQERSFNFSVFRRSRDQLMAARDIYDTHFVQFSLGYLNYLYGDHDAAIACFDRCRELLGAKHFEEYYLVHIKRVLAKMKQNQEYSAWAKDFELYRAALGKAPNFKSRLNKLISDLIRRLLNRNYQPPQYRTYIGSREDLLCVRYDIMTILDYFCSRGMLDGSEVANATRTFTEISVNMDKRDMFLQKNSRIQPVDKALAISFDIRNSTQMDPEDANEVVIELGAAIQAHLAEGFDAVEYTGDGYLIIKSLAQDAIGNADVSEILAGVLQRARDVLNAMRHYPIGIGMSVGSATFFVGAATGEIQYFTGMVANGATRMCDQAKPSGIVLQKEGWPEQSIEDIRMLRLPLTFREITFEDKNGRKWEALASAETTQRQRFLRASRSTEKRLFVSFGDPCNRGCLYCINETIHGIHPRDACEMPKYDKIQALVAEVRKEVADNAQNLRYDDYLLSIGHLNEPLDERNRECTVAVTRTLLCDTGCTIQIATKESCRNIGRFLEALGNLPANLLKRVHILVSLSTIEFARQIEKRDPAQLKQDMAHLLELSTTHTIIPYVKPFLPGITDHDASLVEAIRCFKRVIVGYPYLSKSLMDELSRFCLEQSDLAPRSHGLPWSDCISRYYTSYKLQRVPDASLNAAEISHPGHVNVFRVTRAVRDALEAFQNRLPAEMEVFLSSPCASAALDNKTSYTAIGDPKTPNYRQLFCRGQDPAGTGCRNANCIYHREAATTMGPERVAVELIRRHDDAGIDNAHAIDHFIRVKAYARRIWGEETALEEYRKSERRDEFREALDLACMVHDLGDKKIQGVELRESKAHDLLQELKQLNYPLSDRVLRSVPRIVSRASFDDLVSQGTERHRDLDPDEKTLCMILEDADKIDAIGAIGAARCFSFRKNKGIFDPKETPRTFTGRQIVTGYSSSLIHFYEKLLVLFQLLNFAASKAIASNQHEYLLGFVQQFLDEYSIAYSADSGGDERLQRLKLLANQIATDQDCSKLKHPGCIYVELPLPTSGMRGAGEADDVTIARARS
jgi:uncharacterized protein